MLEGYMEYLEKLHKRRILADKIALWFYLTILAICIIGFILGVMYLIGIF
jgi:hypothetical protein